MGGNGNAEGPQERRRTRTRKKEVFPTADVQDYEDGELDSWADGSFILFFFLGEGGVVTRDKPKSPKSIDLPRQEWDATVATSRL